MERVAAGSHVVTLSALLTPPAEPHAPVLEVVPTPDPQEALERERQRVLEAAHAEGYTQGLKQAEEDVRAAVEKAEQRVQQAHATQGERLAQANQQLESLLQAVPLAIADNDNRIEALAVEVAYAAVLRVLGDAAAQQTLIASLVGQALAEYQQRPLTLRVALNDAEAMATLAHGDDVRVVPDARLAAGACRLETHKGIYDTSIDVRLEALKQAFVNALGASEGLRP